MKKSLETTMMPHTSPTTVMISWDSPTPFANDRGPCPWTVAPAHYGARTGTYVRALRRGTPHLFLTLCPIYSEFGRHNKW